MTKRQFPTIFLSAALANKRLCIAAIISVSLLAACGGKGDGKAEAKPDSAAEAKGEVAGAEKAEEPKTSVAVTVASVAAESFSEVVVGTGVVAARTGHFAAMSAPAPARITTVHVALGDRVKEGDNLVSFETTSFDAAVSSADAALNTAEQAATRAKRLVDAGIAPRKDLETANSELATARANAANAKRALQLARIQSPISGVVTRLNAVLGANADVAQTLVEVSDIRSLDLLLVLSPAMAAKVRNGQSVVMRDGANSETKTAEGKIADVSAVVDSQSRGVTARVAINSQQRTVRIGETLFGQIVTDVHKGAIVIADDGLVPTGEGFQVFVVDAEHKAHARPVTVGGRDGHRVWISDGLKVGERIVTAGAYGLDDGSTVVEAATGKSEAKPEEKEEAKPAPAPTEAPAKGKKTP